MDSIPRHRCLVYEGEQSRHLPVLATVICEQIREHYRCLYVHRPEMVAAMQSRLESKGLDVAERVRQGTLVLSSQQDHLKNGRFDADALLRQLDAALQQSLRAGHKGLWASGDMACEFGPARDFSQLLDYERRLDEFIEKNPEFVAVCQYHADTLPGEAMRQGLLTHPSVFINESLALINPHYLEPHHLGPHSSAGLAEQSPGVELTLNRLLQLEFAI
jgi:hypothetical protein